MLHRQAREARRSPSVFIPFCFFDPNGRPIRQSAVHLELQQFLTAHRKALIELPRDHGKSFQVCARLVWELGQNPSLRVKLVCATEQLAAERSRFLRSAIAENRRVRLVFPGLVPAQPWAAEQFTVRRPTGILGPTVSAAGVGTGSTGARADLLVCDDIVDVRSLTSPAERQRVIETFTNNLVNLLEPDGRLWNLSTPWHPDDLNARLRRNPAYQLFRQAVGPNFEPVWPEKWPVERLRVRRDEIGEASFARGYRLLAIDPGELLIPADWVQFWQQPWPVENEADSERLLAIDPAVSNSTRADATGMVLLARRLEPLEIRVLQATAVRLKAPELVEEIDRWDQLWQPNGILFETNAAFAGIHDLLVRHSRFGWKLQGITARQSKQSRIHALAIPVRHGLVKLRGAEPGGPHPSQQQLFQELTTFPYARHDDLADALALGVNHLLQVRQPRVWS